MALVIEDGSIVADADSFVLRGTFITYAARMGITIADTDATDVQLRKAAEFIASHEANLKGTLVEREQPMAFPRYDVIIDGWYWSGDEIPRNVILCQMALALDINAGTDLYNKPANPNLVTKRERVEGAIDVEYAVSESTGQKLSISSKSDALLNSLLNNSGLMSIRMVRT